MTDIDTCLDGDLRSDELTARGSRTTKRELLAERTEDMHMNYTARTPTRHRRSERPSPQIGLVVDGIVLGVSADTLFALRKSAAAAWRAAEEVLAKAQGDDIVIAKRNELALRRVSRWLFGRVRPGEWQHYLDALPIERPPTKQDERPTLEGASNR